MSAVKATPFRSPSKIRLDPLKLAQGSANSFCNGPNSKCFRLCRPQVSVLTTQLCCVKAASHNVQTYGCACVLIKLYLDTQI